MRVSWFIPPGQSPRDYDRALASVWIRCFDLLGPLEALGVRSTINDPDARCDVAMFLRRQDAAALDLLLSLKRRGVRTAFTTVVNYFERWGADASVNDSVTDEHMRDCVRMAESAHAVVVPTQFIAERAGRHGPWVEVIPDNVTRRHFCHTKPAGDFFRPRLDLRWAGQSSKAQDIATVACAARDLPCDITVVAEKPPDLACRFRFLRWTHGTFPKAIVGGDLCIAPRRLDNSYDLGHSNFKIMVFLAQGIPALVSPQPSYLEVIRDGVNGAVCQSPADWELWLKRLSMDRSLLPPMSEQARASAEPYLTENLAPRYREFFERLLSTK